MNARQNKQVIVTENGLGYDGDKYPDQEDEWVLQLRKNILEVVVCSKRQ